MGLRFRIDVAGLGVQDGLDGRMGVGLKTNLCVARLLAA